MRLRKAPQVRNCSRIFDRELKTISAGKTAHFGSSCIVVGRKAR